MPRFNRIKLYQNRPKIKLVFVKNRQNFRVLGLRPQTPEKASSPLQISGYAPECNHVFALLIFMPPEFSLKPDFKKTLTFIKIRLKLSYFCKNK